MTSQAVAKQPQFKDYCLILQVHPEADAGMVEAAYWHLAKRYNEEAANDPLAAMKLDDLNEAYSVLGSPTRREEYFQVRNSILGIGALPSHPVRMPEPPPLTVLSKQRPQERSHVDRGKNGLNLDFGGFLRTSWQNTAVVLMFLTLAMAGLATSMNLVFVVPLIAVAMLVGGVPLILRVLDTHVVDHLLHDPAPQSRLSDISRRR